MDEILLNNTLKYERGRRGRQNTLRLLLIFHPSSKRGEERTGKKKHQLVDKEIKKGGEIKKQNDLNSKKTLNKKRG